jgi:hypothetical protein
LLAIDRADAEYAYQVYAKWVDRIPRPNAEGTRSTIEAIKKTTPKATETIRIIHRFEFDRSTG